MISARWLRLLQRSVPVFAVLLGAVSITGTATGQESSVQWITGPNTVDMGDGLAQIEVPKGHLFADAGDTRELMRLNGNPPTDQEIGLITPESEDEDWFLVFEYAPVGYVKDDEKDEIDADAILDSIREGTEASNDERKEMGAEALHIKGWFEKPHYDEKTHNLVWAIEAHGDDPSHQVVNYDVRLLGREGYVSATLVAGPDQVAAKLPAVEELLGGFTFTPGQRYAEFKEGDKVAEYGLAALVAGGAGAAAVKLGLFAKLLKLLGKAWKLVIVALVVVAGWLKRLFAGRARQETPAAS